MVSYEMLLLTIPEITQDESKTLESQLDRIIKKAKKGAIISFERWGKYKLAYPVKKNDYGIYFLVRFEIENGTSVINDIKSLFAIRLNDLVMRSIISKFDIKQPLTYERPQSLEEAPSRDVRTFLKEHKMEGLLSTVDSPRKPARSKNNEKLLEEETKTE